MPWVLLTEEETWDCWVLQSWDENAQKGVEALGLAAQVQLENLSLRRQLSSRTRSRTGHARFLQETEEEHQALVKKADRRGLDSLRAAFLGRAETLKRSKLARIISSRSTSDGRRAELPKEYSFWRDLGNRIVVAWGGSELEVAPDGHPLDAPLPLWTPKGEALAAAEGGLGRRVPDLS